MEGPLPPLVHAKKLGGFGDMDNDTQTVQAFTLPDLEATRERSGNLYHEFLRVPAMSAGLYRLAAGASDPQQPHTEDELYYIVQGRARLLVGEQDVAVGPGSLVFVAANVEHRFHDITQDLSVLVFFAPEEYSRRDAQNTQA
jgi:mannose-6-phosphate isomerase-like protein (cupin superfamily)